MNAADPPPYEATRVEKCEARLELTLKVSGLRNNDLLSKSDPFAVVYVNNSASAALPLSLTGGTGVLQPGAALGRGRGLGAGRGRGVGAGRGLGMGRGLLNSAAGKADALMAPLPSLPLGKAKMAARRAPWEHIVTTETKFNTLEASFTTPVRITYFFERAQQLAVDLYDWDSRSADLMSHDYLGSAIFTLSQLVRADEQVLRVPLRMLDFPRRQCGTLTVVADDSSRRRHIARMGVSATLRRPPWFIGPTQGPYLFVSRRASASSNEWIVRYKSPAGRREPGPRNGPAVYSFDMNRVSYELLAMGSAETELKVSLVFVVRHNEKVYGTACTKLSEWRNRAATLISSGGMKRTRGVLNLRKFEVVEEPQFMDYVMGGAEIGLVVGIDFTASNGDSMQPSSLHYSDQFHSNEYETAIRTVGGILAQYDSNNEIPAFGFGAKMPPAFERVSHCFSLTGSSDPVCVGVEGVLDAYRATLYQIRLSGPTEFASLIEHAARYAQYESSRSPTAYTILLVLTDGVINDFEETARSIARASHLPLSIVIIGVGDADFTGMVALDGDHMPLIHDGTHRDIVQFVPFRRYQHQPEMLAAEVLAEIPTQLVEYFSVRGIMPNTLQQHAAAAAAAANAAAAGAHPGNNQNAMPSSPPMAQAPGPRPPNPFSDFPFAPRIQTTQPHNASPTSQMYSQSPPAPPHSHFQHSYPQQHQHQQPSVQPHLYHQHSGASGVAPIHGVPPPGALHSLAPAYSNDDPPPAAGNTPMYAHGAQPYHADPPSVPTTNGAHEALEPPR